MKYVLALLVVALAGVGAMADFSVSFSNTNYSDSEGVKYFDVFITPTGVTPINVGGFNMHFEFTNGGTWAGTPGTVTLAGMHFANNVLEVPGAFSTYSLGHQGGFSAVLDGNVQSPTVANAYAARMFVELSGLEPGTYGFNYDLELIGTGDDFDTSLVANGASNISVSAVPEPSSMALLGLMTVGGVAYRRFRKKVPAKKELEPVLEKA